MRNCYIHHYFDKEEGADLHELNFLCTCNPDIIIGEDKAVMLFHHSLEKQPDFITIYDSKN